MILHIDMDAFYASVEERDQPELIGKPVIVGYSSEGRGVVCAANYEARTYGVHSAQPMVTARRLCPNGVYIRPRHQHYAEVSRQIRAIMESYTPLVEPLSLDEAFLDVTGSEQLFGSSIEIGHKIKQQIQDEVNLVASVGVAPNKYLAKIASDLNKPDGFCVVDPNRVQEFLDPLAVSRLWGVGKVSQKTFKQLGIKTIGELRQVPDSYLERKFGKFGTHLWRLAHGIDERKVQPDHQAKSISHETTFSNDVSDPKVLKMWLLEQTEQVARRMRRNQLFGKTVNLKIRFSDFQTFTRAQSLPHATQTTQEIWEIAAMLLEEKAPSRSLPVRLLGIGMSHLHGESQRQLSLFGEDDHQKLNRLDETTDAIRERFGTSAVQRALRLELPAKRTEDSGKKES
ncbi:DNA polymerase IV [Polystyrenella longa]|uniref:DNA polymerase IV n=1 Tax=Polystyrenella longa TaxID=2528007 RepID=A0A518CSD7_9PLAN|nr:DNA polymerase IV [Polystyrenella longa]QDU82126.1 DNA polymerase IV [Polystyrenella longa]